MTAPDGPRGRSAIWRERADRLRHGWRPWLTSRTGSGIVTAIVVVALVMTAASNGLPAPTGEPSGAPSATPRPVSTPAATAPAEEAWGDLALPAWEPVAELRPVSVNTSGVAIDTAFTLRSRTSADAADLAAGLTADPPISFAIQPGSTAAEATVVPSEPLAEGVVYRIRLADPTGALAGSWAYRTERPLHVVGTVPANETTGVPVDTGIEVEFDQDGVAHIAAHFSIEPAADGRFESHGRTIAFVPRKALATATMYRVTIGSGVTMTGSDQVLEAPVTFAFETAGPGGPTTSWDVGLGRPILEATPDEAPLLGVDVVQADTAPAPTSLPFEIYRLVSFDAARAAAITLAGDPGWGSWATNNLVDTAGLPRVAAFDGSFESTSPYGYMVVRFPAPLAAGWYVVVVPRDGRDRQVLLQVTTLSAFALTSETRTLAWVNDTATDAPIAGAEVADPAGRQLGTTGPAGLLDVATPASLVHVDTGDGSMPGPTLLTVLAPDGRQLLVVLGMRSNTSAYDWARNDMSRADAPDRRWWRVTSTDRTTYRSTDTVHAWGLLRSRLDGSVPAGLELTLRSPEGSSEAGPWLAQIPITPTARGTWAADVPIADLPLGGYVVELHAAGVVASSTWLAVAEIRKPAYQIEVVTDRGATVAGEPVSITGRATFFDGTPMVGLDLTVDAFAGTRTVTTDADGRLAVTLDARAGDYGPDYHYISVTPVNPEEGEISGSTAVFVYPSSSWIEASGTVTGGQVEIAGTLSQVDLERVARELAANGWPEDPAGAPVSGATVTVRVVELVSVTRQVGTTYDYLEKKVIPLLEYSTREVAVGTYTTTSGAGGSIALSVPAPTADGTYSATLTARDAAGRTARTNIQASPPGDPGDVSGPVRPYLEKPNTCGGYREEQAVGETIELTVHDGDGSVSTGGRYLFVVAGGGIRDAAVQEASTLTRTYAEADLPSLDIVAIRFQDGVYVETNRVFIRTRPEERTLGVEITADRSRYAPGGRAGLSIRTTDAAGNPVAADVVVRAVDEKLFAIGGAFDVDVLSELLSPLGDGLLQSYVSHPLPMPLGGDGCGDTTGGGRDDFRDSALFTLLSTGGDGRGSVAFDLPDDLTSWHVSATAIASDLQAGSGSLLVPVGLPFFADAILASDYLAGERPILRVRSFGDDLAASDRVRFTISAPDLLLPPTSVDAAAFATATLELPELPLGVHDVTVSAAVIGDASRTDRMTRRIVVRSSRLSVATTEVTTPAGAGDVGGTGLTTYVVTDAGRGSLVPLLTDLAHGSGARSDRLLAATLARELLVGSFGFDAAALPPIDLDLARYQRAGIALLPYSSTDLPLTALMAIVAPERLDRDMARFGLTDWLHDGTATREREIIATAGLAGLGDDVLDELRAVDIESVTTREALWTALGLIASGDEDGARVIERALLDEHGQALGPWVRLDVGETLADTLDAASLLALVAAGVGDPVAASLDRYVREVRTSEGLYALSGIGVIRWTLDRLPRAAATFAWTVDGERHEEALAPGASWSVALTERQRAGLQLETIEGAIAVVASWTRVPSPADLPSGELVTIERTVTPAGGASTTGLVKVRLHVVFAPTVPSGCWDVSDRTPSGLAPLASVHGWPGGEDSRLVIWPYEVSGQRVGWCLDPSARRDVVLGYSARLVSAGTFTWEPAVVQSVSAPEIGATTPVTTYTIR